MPETHVVSARAAHAWVSCRLPIMEGLRALGLRDRQIARALGIGRVAISAWADGSKPIPPLRHAQLIWLLGVLIGRFGKLQVNSRYARRSKLACDAARAWLDLARDELLEDTGGDVPEQMMLEAHRLGMEVLARLEAQ